MSPRTDKPSHFSPITGRAHLQFNPVWRVVALSNCAGPMQSSSNLCDRVFRFWCRLVQERKVVLQQLSRGKKNRQSESINRRSSSSSEAIRPGPENYVALQNFTAYPSLHSHNVPRPAILLFSSPHSIELILIQTVQLNGTQLANSDSPLLAMTDWGETVVNSNLEMVCA